MSLESGSDPSGTPPPVTPQPVTPPQGADWTASLTPDLKQLVDTKGYKSPADVVQAYAHAQKAIGADKIVLPKDGVWDDEARAKLGIPKDAAGYELKRPEMPAGVSYDENFEKAALPVAHKLGLTPVQLQGLMEFYAGYTGQAVQGFAKSATDELAASQALLQKEWGQAYPQKVAQATRAVQHFGGDGLVKFLNESGMGNNPELVKAFAKIGSMTAEDTIKLGKGASTFNLTPQEARAEATRIMGDRNGPYWKNDHPEHAMSVKRVNELFEAASGDAA